MNDIIGGFGLVQLEKSKRSNGRRREIVNYENDRLSDLEWLEKPVEKSYPQSGHDNYVVKLDRRDDLIAHLQKQRISAGVHYIPNLLYRNYG